MTGVPSFLSGRSKRAPGTADRPWILVAAYDVSSGATSEGYIAFNVLRLLKQRFRIVLLTRKNNRDRIREDVLPGGALEGIRVLGFDLPKWARWWKRGRKLYFPYAYLWQLCWPLAVLRARRARSMFSVCHVLNFHNDSIPSLAWVLGVPLVWGPINHNELGPAWRRASWPWRARKQAEWGFLLRRLAWQFDPWLGLMKRRSAVIFSAGPWVEQRLRLTGSSRIVRLSQLGVSAGTFLPPGGDRTAAIQAGAGHLLVHAGRLDWIKGLDVAIGALSFLPTDFRLVLIGRGPAERILRAWAEKTGVSARVRFEQPVARAKLADLYEKASVFVFPSAEAAGLAWIEALACGLPVVGLEGQTLLSAGGRDIEGVVVSPAGTDRGSSMRAFAEAIERASLMLHDRRVISEAVLDKFSWEVVAERIARAYGECGRRTSPRTATRD